LCGWQTFATGCGLLLLFSALVLWFVLTSQPNARAPLHLVSALRMPPMVASRLICLIVVCHATTFLGNRVGFSRRIQVGMVTAAVLYLAVGDYLLNAPWYRERYMPEEQHTVFVAQYLKEHREPSEPVPCVYWNTEIDRIWFRLPAISYVTIYQMAGCAFNEKTALEGKRRVRLVGRFEAADDRLSQKPVSARSRQIFADFRDCPPDAPPPTRADLLQLCREEMLDYAVLQVAIDDLYSATDGRYYIYDCKRVRNLVPSAAGANR
jgi:hypothetical protein